MNYELKSITWSEMRFPPINLYNAPALNFDLFKVIKNEGKCREFKQKNNISKKIRSLLSKR